MIGAFWGKYKIIRLIGEGGMASVYEAEHEILRTKVAIKILHPILSANPQIRDRFRTEAKLMASLDHPNITKVIDFVEQDQLLYIVMEFLQGEDLNQKINKNGPLSETEIFQVLPQVLGALQYAHEIGILHRDIKPSNIFLLPNGFVKILDFGVAKLFGQGNEMTQTGAQIGTPIYMSPEQVKSDKSIDHRSDIYSLGVTMFYAIQGHPPYNSDTASQFDIFSKIVYEPLPEISNSGHLSHQIKKACQKDRAQRFQSCEEWIQELKSEDRAKERNDNGQGVKGESGDSLDNIHNEEANIKETKISWTPLIYFVVLAVLYLAIGHFYTNEKKSYQSVATQYLQALKDKRWEDAKALGTDRTKSYVGTFESLPNMESGITDVKDVKCEETSDTTATCSFCCSNDGKTSLNLVRRNKKWLVDDGKQMPDMSEQEQGGETGEETNYDTDAYSPRKLEGCSR